MTGSGWLFGALNASRQAGQAVIMSWPIGAGMILFIASGPLVPSATRKQIPEQERPFKVPGGHIIPAVAFWSSNPIVYWSGLGHRLELMPAVVLGRVLEHTQQSVDEAGVEEEELGVGPA